MLTEKFRNCKPLFLKICNLKIFRFVVFFICLCNGSGRDVLIIKLQQLRIPMLCIRYHLFVYTMHGMLSVHFYVIFHIVPRVQHGPSPSDIAIKWQNI